MEEGGMKEASFSRGGEGEDVEGNFFFSSLSAMEAVGVITFLFGVDKLKGFFFIITASVNFLRYLFMLNGHFIYSHNFASLF